jgi:hypothetical protein
MNGYTFTFQSMEADPLPALSSTSAGLINALAPSSSATIGGFTFETATT